jgi:hypothetical protein
MKQTNARVQSFLLLQSVLLQLLVHARFALAHEQRVQPPNGQPQQPL